MDLNSIKSFDDFFIVEAEVVEKWLNQVWAGEIEEPDNFNWLGLAEIASTNAQNFSAVRAGTGMPDLKWAQVAVSVYEWLASKSKSDYHSFTTTAMRIRALMIKSFGSVAGHPILDPSKIILWFRAHLNLSIEEAKSWSIRVKQWLSESKTKEADSVEFQKLRELRQIKNRLVVINLLVEYNRAAVPEDLLEWLPLKNILP